MIYFRLAWRNIWRNKRRTIISMASVFFAVIAAVLMRASVSGAFEKMVSDVVRFSSGYIQIHKKGYWQERSVENTFEDSRQLEETLRNEKAITAFSPRLESFMLASSGERTRGILVTGIDPAKESAITMLDKKLQRGEFITDHDPGILLAEGLAAYLRLDLKDTVILFGQGYHGVMAAGKYPVRGIIKMNNPELNKSMSWLPATECMNLLGTGRRYSAMVLMLGQNDDMEKVKGQLVAALPASDYEVMTWKEMFPEMYQFIQADSSAHIITVSVLYLVILFGIFGTILMMLNERMHEFGILIAIGMKKRILAFIVFMEIIMMSFMGMMIGIAAAFPVVLYFNRHPIRFTGKLAKAYERYGMEPFMPASIRVENFTSQAYVVFSMVLILSLYPFYKIAKLKVIKAINS